MDKNSSKSQTNKWICRWQWASDKITWIPQWFTNSKPKPRYVWTSLDILWFGQCIPIYKDKSYANFNWWKDSIIYSGSW